MVGCRKMAVSIVAAGTRLIECPGLVQVGRLNPEGCAMDSGCVEVNAMRLGYYV